MSPLGTKEAAGRRIADECPATTNAVVGPARSLRDRDGHRAQVSSGGGRSWIGVCPCAAALQEPRAVAGDAVGDIGRMTRTQPFPVGGGARIWTVVFSESGVETLVRLRGRRRWR